MNTNNGEEITIDGITLRNATDVPPDGDFSYMMNPNTTYLEGASFDFVEKRTFLFIITIFIV